jgi:hypothetical protein
MRYRKKSSTSPTLTWSSAKIVRAIYDRYEPRSTDGSETCFDVEKDSAATLETWYPVIKNLQAWECVTGNAEQVCHPSFLRRELCVCKANGQAFKVAAADVQSGVIKWTDAYPPGAVSSSIGGPASTAASASTVPTSSSVPHRR